jgi:protein-tyrosine-phosphatase
VQIKQQMPLAVNRVMAEGSLSGAMATTINVEAQGFVQHLKLPRYIDFQAELNLIRKLRRDYDEAQSKQNGVETTPKPESVMNILFVCSGNMCRSPLAEALVRHKVTFSTSGSFSSPIEVKSAGTSAESGLPMSLAMEIILQEQGIESTHQSQQVTWNLLNWADLILTMTQAQKILLQSQGPQIASKLATLNEYSGHTSQLDIDDPHGCDLDSYRQCAEEIGTACDGLLNRLRTTQNQLIKDE